ncbi:fluoride efflux transporter CrcB [Thermaerobacillus caldiproteolyticus]|uniref:Fluoride-specific ion channel FluC n=1 Tax=Thermaerobacillus caldiproteolyticus TaxID=247480 RepID=A0A7W0C026_9BACL|nr:fluoride efflux transporter CrcB [Anoxybacillus caldiproteolyticus]MBA2876235.1 CrcB protein [Anoxybacillus caldiproteolyticus]
MNIIAVGIGGFFGAVLRYCMGQWIPVHNGFPLPTLIINLLGCLFLGWFFTITLQKIKISPTLRLCIGTGFTGSFTTFSTFSVETVILIKNNQIEMAILYVLLSVVGGIALAFSGIGLARINRSDKVKGKIAK